MLKDEKILAQDIKDLMCKNNLNKLDMMKKLKLSYPTILNKLKEPDNFKLNELRSICSVLQVDHKILKK
tara:strand:+ start:147 stop:353 length:207 start_codon:yes stop_codon:yes gene_type:complete